MIATESQSVLKICRLRPAIRARICTNPRDALPLIFAVDNLEAARAAQARSQASLNAVREEDLRKQRIPIQIIDEQNMRDFELYLFLDLNGHLVGRLFPSTSRAWILPLLLSTWQRQSDMNGRNDADENFNDAIGYARHRSRSSGRHSCLR